MGVGEPGQPAARPELWSAPNPYSRETWIHYRLASACSVVLTVHDVTGREIARLEEGWREAGPHALAFRGEGLASGLYWFRLAAGGRAAVHRSVVLR